MRTTRRRFVQGALATTALSGVPSAARSQGPTKARTIYSVPESVARRIHTRLQNDR